MKEWLMSDLHVHTKFSDGSMGIEEVIDLYGKLNFDVIAITDHQMDSVSKNLPHSVLPYNWIENENDFNVYYEKVLSEAERAKKEYNMLVIPGVEFTNYILNIHVVGIDVKKYIEVSKDMSQTLIIAKHDGMLLIGAHPFDTRFYKIGGGLWKNKEVSQYIDVWEAGNGINFFPHVVENGHKIIANTDFHGVVRENGIKGWKTIINAEKNAESVKQAILDQRVALHKYR